MPYTMPQATADLDRAIDHLNKAAQQIEDLIGTSESGLTSRIIDDLADIRPSVRLVDETIRLLDELAQVRGEA
jgi:hypothetical protein